VGRPKSETRQLVAVRFTPSDLIELRREADRRGVSVPQLRRESALKSARASLAGDRRSVLTAALPPCAAGSNAHADIWSRLQLNFESHRSRNRCSLSRR
jgi:hypothetical protein